MEKRTQLELLIESNYKWSQLSEPLSFSNQNFLTNAVKYNHQYRARFGVDHLELLEYQDKKKEMYV